MYRVDGEVPHGGLGGARPTAGELAPFLSRRQRMLKRAIDLILAMLFLVLFLPVCVAVAIGVWRSSPGAVIYSQPRVGRHGRVFRFYKFRSMVRDSDEVLSSFLNSDPEALNQWNTYQKLEKDPRITRFGRFIRRTSLDELPQLWNVIKGEMSIVGPRPCMLSQQALYGPHWDSYCAVQPGLTGLWQVSGRNRLTYAERVRLDAHYVRRWSIWLDVQILLRTVKVVFTGEGSQ